MNELALFSGAGGGILGTRLLGFRPVCAVEIEPDCREVLLRRQDEGHLAPFPIWDDVRTFYGKPWRGRVEVLSAGFPCTPWSAAGKNKGDFWTDDVDCVDDVMEKEMGNKLREMARRFVDAFGPEQE